MTEFTLLEELLG